MAFLGQRSWQNKTSGTCSIHFLQQSNSQAARAIPQKDAKACCLNRLSSDRGRVCSVSEPLFSAQLCNLLHMHSSAADLPAQKILPEFGAF